MNDVKYKIINELHKPARKHFKRRRVITKGINDLIQADLVEMLPYAKTNRNFRYILVVINVFSKFVWVEPVKRKTAKDVTSAMNKILSKMHIKPKNLQTDNGKEFYNKEFKNLTSKYKINHYSSFSNLKSSVVERVNRTLKNMMWRQFSYQGSYKWINILQDIVSKYNSKKHSTIDMRPVEVTQDMEPILLSTVYSNLKTVDPRKNKLKKGDNVRISKYREAFSKGYTPNWSNEIFKIRKVNLTNPVTYLLEDQNKQEIQGSFYSEELQKTNYPDIFLIEKILKRKGDRIFVKWLGLDKSQNSWINKNKVL